MAEYNQVYFSLMLQVIPGGLCSLQFLWEQPPSWMLLSIVLEEQWRILENLALIIKCYSQEVIHNTFAHNSLARTSYMAPPNHKGAGGPVFWMPGGKGNWPSVSSTNDHHRS